MKNVLCKLGIHIATEEDGSFFHHATWCHICKTWVDKENGKLVDEEWAAWHELQYTLGTCPTPSEVLLYMYGQPTGEHKLNKYYGTSDDGDFMYIRCSCGFRTNDIYTDTTFDNRLVVQVRQHLDPVKFGEFKYAENKEYQSS